MKFILGTKVNMTQIFDEAGMVHPVTALKASPMTVTAIKTVATDGYNAIQVGYGTRGAKNINKAQLGQMNGGNFMYLREVRTEGEPTFKIGDSIDLTTFATGDTVTVSSISKGKGFQGAVKRYGFKGGPRSHGQKHSEREPGSIGGGGRDGGRVAKGKRMAGRMGGDRITTKGLTVVSVKPETGEIFIRGSVPGRRGTLVEVNG
ncbi:50S ribosomal protein L3 [Patescibacteria group bacterium]|nr:50S ribosomal protein L3 [Patescibacteria group bacterium]